MAKSKATHSGTCQCCGNHQKLPNGRLSKHGYTVQWGYFDGVCDGAGYEPLEVSCDRIPVYIERLENFLKDRKAFLKDLNAGKLVNITFRSNGYGLVRAQRNSLTVELDDGALTHDWEERDDEFYRVNFSYKGFEYDFHEKVEKVFKVGYGFGRSKKEAIEDFLKKNNANIIYSTERTIKEVKAAIKERKEILENWKPRPELLVEVEKKSNEPPVHLAGGWTDTAVCVASRMGAQRFNGRTTDDKSKVTCKKCLKRIEKGEV